MINYLMVIMCYFIGNISFSYLLTKIIIKKDIRNFGSGNAGTTNVLRVLGKKYAVLVLIGDALKGMIPIVLAQVFITNETFIALCGLAVILGHNWPVFMNFRGGKGIATSIGVFVIYDPIIALICVSIGVIIIIFSKYVSLGSIMGMAILPIAAIFLSRNREEIILTVLVSMISIYKHRSNIMRLIKGNENKLMLNRKV